MLRALILTAFYALALAPAAEAQSPAASVKNTERDFGEIRQGDVLTEQFEIRNTGDAPLLMTGLDFSAYGMNARVRQEIAPGESASLELTWDTSRYVGEAVGQARLSTNDRARPEIILTLSGVLIPPIEVSPFPAFYLSQFAGESIERSVTIRNHQDHPVAITGIEGESPRFASRIEIVEPGREYRLHVEVSPETPIGRWRDRLRVLTDDKKRDKIGVEVNILVKPDIALSAEALDFGRIDISDLRAEPTRAELLTETLLIERRQGPMKLTALRSDLPFLDARQTPAGPSQRFRIDIAPIAAAMEAGTFEGTLRISTDDPEFPEIAIPVRAVVVE
ncbi:DUF1573 domain-containing protein [bacterium]|nr:DUF1573 domain-containing protein [bacterium]